jgi:hypothetical protein
MTQEELNLLEVGDTVQHKLDGEAYYIIGKYEDGYRAIRIMHVTNPTEWKKADVSKNGVLYYLHSFFAGTILKLIYPK